MSKDVPPSCGARAEGWCEVNIEFTQFVPSRHTRQPLPPAKRMVLVQLAAQERQGMPGGVAVGHLRFAAGDPDCPVWTIPGIGGEVVAWCDCIPAGFAPPLWAWKQGES